MPRERPFCSDVSLESGESLEATASRIDHWLLVEYRGLWARRELADSALPGEVKSHLREQLRGLPHSRLLFVRRPERRRHPGIAVYVARSHEDSPLLHGLELDAYDQLLDLDLAARTPPGEPLASPLFVVCTHGKRDPCCARRGRPLYEGIREQVDEGWVWQSTHVGGDRFAGNLVCLPHGLYFGRVGRLSALDVLAEHLAGRIDLRHYRGRSCHSFVVQAAERAVRVRTGRVGIDDVRFDGGERLADDRWRVRLRAGTGLYEAIVEARPGDLAELTCAAVTPKRPRHYRARDVRILPGRAA
jgi:hypothetical protein